MKKHLELKEWVGLLQDAGVDEAKRKEWHKLFEARYPEGHQAFLEWLSLPAAEIDRIRANSR